VLELTFFDSYFFVENMQKWSETQLEIPAPLLLNVNILRFSVNQIRLF